MYHMEDCSNISHFLQLLSYWNYRTSMGMVVYDKPRHPQCQSSFNKLGFTKTPVFLDIFVYPHTVGQAVGRRVQQLLL